MSDKYIIRSLYPFIFLSMKTFFLEKIKKTTMSIFVLVLFFYIFISAGDPASATVNPGGNSISG